MNYSKLFSVLKKQNIKRTDLVNMGLISASTLDRLLHNKCVYMITLEILCAYLDCKLSDICEVDKGYGDAVHYSDNVRIVNTDI